MSIRVKVVCTSCDEDEYGIEQLYLDPAMEGWIYLPILNPDAKGKHEVGKEYYVDITPVER